MKTVVYPGSFDPCTNGHLDIIARAAKLADKVIVAVLVNSSKTPLFTAEERVALLKTAVSAYDNVEVQAFSGLLVDFMKMVDSTVIIKGIRAVSDFEYEFQMALTNHTLFPEIETLFIPSGKDYMFLSSSIVKEIAKYGGSLEGLVPDALIPVINKRCHP
ncbi:MAG: pantetheine-phosphate adenylyltransferase [Clostridia bacterium]|nr:pantetheine-phosphate adenylyltransferase [Clostridia bacterium]